MVWGLPLVPWTFRQTLDQVEQLIRQRRPTYFITANLAYAMLTAQDARLTAVNQGAAFILADGMPLVWASRLRQTAVPERVTGADLVPALCEVAAAQGQAVFLLGGAPGVGDEVARRLGERYPGIRVVGVESPPFREPTPEEHAQLLARIREARPDLLFVAFGQPKGELWLAANCADLGVPVCAQIGASLDFLAGRVSRAPRWVQRVGLEWAYRISREPTRLIPRYARNLLFGVRMFVADFLTPRHRRG